MQPKSGRPLQLADLHARFVAGDEAARDELAARLLESTTRIVRSRFPRTDPCLLSEAAEDAVLKYLNDPTKFDSRRSGLQTYIARLAFNRAFDLLRRDERRLRVESTVKETLGRSLATGEPAKFELMPGTSTNRIDLSALPLTAPQRALLEARMERERRTPVLAAIIGAGERPIIEQRAAVKRMADAVHARLRRLVARRRAGRK